MRIEQAIIGNGPQSGMHTSFGKNFLKRWNLKQYSDPNKPAFFFEASANIDNLLNHPSYKIVWPVTVQDYEHFINSGVLNHLTNVFILAGYKPQNYPDLKVKRFFLEIKDFSEFKPNRLGDKIYYHSTWEGENPQCMHIINWLKETLDYELITTEHKSQSDYYNQSFLKENYYDKCFLNLNFTRGGSISTAIELGLMGRKTIVGDLRLPHGNSVDFLRISNSEAEGFKNFNYYNYPSFIKFFNEAHLLEIIENEAKKINSIQASVAPKMPKEDWLDIDFWKSECLDIQR